jgi:endonuclease/exonuclease/phosphatase family metal-dependent hydrolase
VGRRRRTTRARPRGMSRLLRWALGSFAACLGLAVAAAGRPSSGQAPHRTLPVEAPGPDPGSGGAGPAPSPRGSGDPVRSAAAGGGAPPPSVSAFSSPEACEELLARGRPARAPGTLRVGTWNIRWFPDGGPGARPRTGKGPVATHLDWLACALASLDVDAVALQEIKGTARARRALGAVLQRLNALTGGHWQVELDDCPGLGRQHVGILHDARRLRRRDGFDIGALNPRGPAACDHMLRPGRAVYFERDGGADFHLVAVHFKSGIGRTDLELREQTTRRVGRAHAFAESRVPDTDVILAGDWNTMGCSRCKPKVTAEEELGELDRSLGAVTRPFRRVPATIDCSAYYRGRPAFLDHFVVHRGMREVPASARAEVHGFCADVACRRLDAGSMPRAYHELSDHCPLVLEFDDRDLDG